MKTEHEKSPIQIHPTPLFPLLHVCHPIQLIKLKDLVGFERYASLMSTVDASIHKLLYDYVNTMVPLVPVLE